MLSALSSVKGQTYAWAEGGGHPECSSALMLARKRFLLIPWRNIAVGWLINKQTKVHKYAPANMSPIFAIYI